MKTFDPGISIILLYTFDIEQKNKMQSYHFLKGIFMLVNLLKNQFSLYSLKNRNTTFSLNGVLKLLIRDINRTQKLWVYHGGRKFLYYCILK